MGATTTVTVLFTDIVGSTDLLVRLGEREWEAHRRRHVDGQRAVIAEHRGTEVKNTGDGLMVVFRGAADAIRCALAMHGQASHVVADGAPIALRVGVATGEATGDGEDWFGTPVVEAARLCALAGPSQTLATALVAQLARTHAEARFGEPTPRLLKGLGEVPVVEVHAALGPTGTMYAEVEASQPITHRLVAQLDRWDSLPSMAALQEHVHHHLGLVPGQTACDIGCGAGTRLARMADAVGTEGTVIGIDPSPAMIDEARRRTQGHPASVQLEVRDGRHTGLPDHRCDAVLMERVAQHVGDLDAFLAEAIRITRPGGRIAYVDTDWGSLVIDPGDPELVRRLAAGMSLGYMAAPWAGRTLHRTMVEGGLERVTSQPFAISPGPWVIPSMAQVLGRLVEANRLTGDELDQFQAELTEAAERDTFTFTLTMYAAIGQVPAA